MLQVSSDHLFFIRPAKTITLRPSGGLLVAINKKFRCSCLESGDLYLAVDLGGIVLVCVCIPTNYRNSTSSQQYASACASLLKLNKKELIFLAESKERH